MSAHTESDMELDAHFPVQLRMVGSKGGERGGAEAFEVSTDHAFLLCAMIEGEDDKDVAAACAGGAISLTYAAGMAEGILTWFLRIYPGALGSALTSLWLNDDRFQRVVHAILRYLSEEEES